MLFPFFTCRHSALLSLLGISRPPSPFLPPPSFCPLFCRSSGPIVWTASSTPSSSSGSPLKPSSTVSSSQTPPQLSGGWRGRIVKFTYFVLISSLFNRPAMNCKHVCAQKRPHTKRDTFIFAGCHLHILTCWNDFCTFTPQWLYLFFTNTPHKFMLRRCLQAMTRLI